MRFRKHLISRTMGLVVATSAPFVGVLAGGAVPASAAQSSPFAAFYQGDIQITGADASGNPTSADYGGDGGATQLGPSTMDGKIVITGPAACANGFTASHTDTLTAASGSTLVVAVTETSCPRASEPGTYDCTGRWAVVGGTGRYASATGSGSWGGSVTFGANGAGTFSTAYSGRLTVGS